MNLETIAKCFASYCHHSDHLPREGRERAVLQTADLSLRMEQIIAALKATETTSGFAELVKGETIDRTVHGTDMVGPMYDMSPEGKACEGKQDHDSGHTRPRR